MMRNIALFFILLLLKSYNAVRQKRSKVFTFLRSDRKLPGPSMLFNKSIASGVFEFEFKTFVNLALVLYQDDNGISDHIQVTIENGRIYFSFYVNRNGTPGVGVTFKSNNTYNDFRWHSLRIERNSSYTSIVLDNGKEGENFKTFGYQSRFVSNLLIGGFRDDQYSNDLSNPSAFWLYVSPFSKRGFFNACVRNIKYGKTRTDMKEISNDYIEKNKVTKGCNLNYCHKPVPICKNNGRCKPDGKTKVTCNCLWTGYEGKYCDKDALELTLNGTYKVKHDFVSRAFAEEKYTFRIKTSQENAVLFYAKGPPNHADLVLIEIEHSRLKVVVNLGGDREGGNFTVISEQKISDGKWHFVQYVKGMKYYTLKVDSKTKTSGRFSEYFKMDYHTDSYLGEISKQRYKHGIKIQDFIWEAGLKTKANFITSLFEAYQNINEGFWVMPENVRPNFNRALPNFTPRPMPRTHSSPKPHCSGGHCTRTSVSDTGPGKGPRVTTRIPKLSENRARNEEDDDDDDSSVTWIVVVTVIFSLLLFAAIAFFIYKWNQRYSGDFQVNRKPIGPAGTIVHYQDDAHREKQRQMKL